MRKATITIYYLTKQLIPTKGRHKNTLVSYYEKVAEIGLKRKLGLLETAHMLDYLWTTFSLDNVDLLPDTVIAVADIINSVNMIKGTRGMQFGDVIQIEEASSKVQYTVAEDHYIEEIIR